MQCRSIHIFVGDWVKTPDGVGRVDDINTWRDRVVEMRKHEAVEFNDACYRELGVDFRKLWAEVFVMVQGRRVRFLATQIEVLEGRDAEKIGFDSVTREGKAVRGANSGSAGEKEEEKKQG